MRTMLEAQKMSLPRRVATSIRTMAVEIGGFLVRLKPEVEPPRPPPPPRPMKEERTVMLDGEEYSVIELADLYGLRAEVLYRRIFSDGWDVRRACETPVRGETW